MEQMTNAELIKALRYCGNSQETGCKGCPLWDKPMDACFQTVTAAADAIESADKRIAELNTKCADLQSQINEMENEIEELLPKEGARQIRREKHEAESGKEQW